MIEAAPAPKERRNQAKCDIAGKGTYKGQAITKPQQLAIEYSFNKGMDQVAKTEKQQDIVDGSPSPGWKASNPVFIFSFASAFSRRTAILACYLNNTCLIPRLVGG